MKDDMWLTSFETSCPRRSVGMTRPQIAVKDTWTSQTTKRVTDSQFMEWKEDNDETIERTQENDWTTQKTLVLADYWKTLGSSGTMNGQTRPRNNITHRWRQNIITDCQLIWQDPKDTWTSQVTQFVTDTHVMINGTLQFCWWSKYWQSSELNDGNLHKLQMWTN